MIIFLNKYFRNRQKYYLDKYTEHIIKEFRQEKFLVRLVQIGAVVPILRLKCNKGLCRTSMIWPQHVDKGKLNKCILKESVDTVFCLTQLYDGPTVYTYPAPLRRIGHEYSANVAWSTFQSLKRLGRYI